MTPQERTEPAAYGARQGRVAGKCCVVVGAGSIGPGWGNGKAAAVLYAREGAKVLAVDARREAAEETAALIRGEGGIVEVLAGDMSDPAVAAAAVAHAAALWGGVDIVHFNIGISRPGDLLETSLEDWRAVFAVNLDAALHVSRAALPVMERQGQGAFVFISSIAAVTVGGYAYVGYEVSKAALNRLAQSIAVAYAAKGIRANVIMPGLIDTPHVSHHIAGKVAAGEIDELAARRASAVPMRRQGTAWDIAEAAVFLASDAAGYITGVTLPVDGGLTLTSPFSREEP
jgi:NAD(P)-dependent dehydrogenase (short-subunit alcohol dehydrogenase family)